MIDRRRDSEPWWLVPVIVWAVVTTSLALFAFFTFGQRYDFMMFYQDGVAWNHGDPLYRYPNMNPPTLTVALFAPLARLRFDVARVAWVVGGVLAVAASLRLVVRELGLTHHRTVRVVALLLATHGTYVALANGQVTWLLLFPVTKAWIAFRGQRLVRTGLWLAPAIAIKPSLALTALLLPWPAWPVAGALSAAITGAGVLLTGWGAWSSWLSTAASVAWISQHLNASLWGLAARWESGVSLNVRIGDLSPIAAGVVVCAGLALGWSARRSRDPDTRFTLAVLWHVLISPLGWIHYLPLAVGPVTASWPRNRWAPAAFALSCVPLGFLSVHVAWSAAFVRTVGSIYPAAVLCAWVAWTARRDAAPREAHGES